MSNGRPVLAGADVDRIVEYVEANAADTVGDYRWVMGRTEAAEDRRKPDGRNLFEVFVEAAYGRVSGAPFFFLCLVIVIAWMVSVPWWTDLKSWELAIHTVASVLTLLLLALLENASRRSEEAAQEKMNVLAEALAALMDSLARNDPDLDDAVRKLREAVGLEERH